MKTGTRFLIPPGSHPESKGCASHEESLQLKVFCLQPTICMKVSTGILPVDYVSFTSKFLFWEDIYCLGHTEKQATSARYPVWIPFQILLKSDSLCSSFHYHTVSLKLHMTISDHQNLAYESLWQKQIIASKQLTKWWWDIQTGLKQKNLLHFKHWKLSMFKTQVLGLLSIKMCQILHTLQCWKTHCTFKPFQTTCFVWFYFKKAGGSETTSSRREQIHCSTLPFIAQIHQIQITNFKV